MAGGAAPAARSQRRPRRAEHHIPRHACREKGRRRGGCHPLRLLTALRAAGNRWLSAPLSRAGSPPGAGDLAGRLNISASGAWPRHVALLLPPTAAAGLRLSEGRAAVVVAGGEAGAFLALISPGFPGRMGKEGGSMACWRSGTSSPGGNAAAFCTGDGASHALPPERFRRSNEEEDFNAFLVVVARAVKGKIKP